MKIDQPKFHYMAYKKSLRYRAATIWNIIPMSIREKTSLESLKNALRNDPKILNQINFGTNSTARARDPDNYLYY